MDVKALTEDEIRASGMRAPVNDLGLAGAIRFLQLFHKGAGDYTEDRHQWLDCVSRNDILDRVDAVQRREAARE